MRLLLVIIGLFFQCACTPADGFQKPTAAPFAPYERLTFEVRWSFIPIGSVVLEVLPMKMIEDTPHYHFSMTAKTNAFADSFYKVRSRIESFTDSAMTHSVRYTKRQREGRVRRDVVVRFDWPAKRAYYNDFYKNKQKTTALLPGAFDPLSAFYYVRGLELKKGARAARPVSDGKKCVLGKAQVVARETLRLEGGTFDTFRLQPELKHVGGVFEKSKNAKINLWVTADHRKIPVKITSKVIIGSFVGELTSMTGTR